MQYIFSFAYASTSFQKLFAFYFAPSWRNEQRTSQKFIQVFLLTEIINFVDKKANHFTLNVFYRGYLSIISWNQDLQFYAPVFLHAINRPS